MERIKIILEKRKRIILTVTILSIAMILINTLYVGTFSFIPLETKDLSPDNSDDVDIENIPVDIDDIEKIPVDIDDIEEESFICTINGKKYLAEYITKEDVEEMKTQCDFRDSSKNYNQIINGHGTGLAPATEKAYDNLVGKLSIKELISESVKSSDSATSIDLSSEIYFPPVDTQGSQGSCSTWANVYYAYGYMEAKDYGWNAKSGNPEYLLSPAWAYNKLALDKNYGSWPVDNAKLMTEWGVATLNTMPYNAGDVDSWGEESAWREAPYHRPLDYTLITYKGDPTINTIKSLLASGIPVTFIIDHNQYYAGLNKATGDYILSSGEYDSTRYSHAQCFVGYDDSITEGSDVGAFRVVNSWGDDWMDDGFYWLTYKAFKEFGGPDWQQLIFYTDREDYEPSLIATWEFSSTPTLMDDIITLGVGPHDAPLDMINPHYENDIDCLFPTFMAMDISEFQSYYDSDHFINFYLELETSNTPGIISSFLIERYVSGVLEEITPQSFDVPKITPGHVNTLFRVTESPIHIDQLGDGDYTWEEASTQPWCSGSGTSTDPYVIQYLIINANGTGSSILIENSNAYFRIENCEISNAISGIKLSNTNNGIISGNTINKNQIGILLDNSDYNTISGNTASYNKFHGILLQESKNNIVSRNTANYNWIGIFLAYSNDNTVSRNTANYNWIGILIGYNSNDNTIWGNLIKNNQINGIYIVNPNCHNNLIYFNSLIGTFGWHASDSGTNTQWNNLGIGNYWDTHTAPDSNDDGIVDTTYTWIKGSAGSVDNFPLAESPVHEGEKVYIDDSGMSAWDWSKTAKLKVWCSGSGTEEDPYLIQDLRIDGGGSGSCILIENSNAYFRIENCKVYNAESGIELGNTDNGIISGNIVNDNDGHGIYLHSSHDNTVSGNKVNNNLYYGIYSWSSDDNIISGNTANNNGDYGIFLEISNNNSFSGNIMIESGLFIIGNNREQCSSHNIDTTNLVNGKPIYYYANKIGLDPANFTNAGQVILANCSDSIISNLNISHVDIGILLLYSSNNTISKCNMLYNAGFGIYLYYSNNNIISGNTANNNRYGILLMLCNSNIVSGNTANKNLYGIYLEYSDDNTVLGNTAYKNCYGISLYESDYNTISGNIAKNNVYSGGIGLHDCNNNIVSGNTASYNEFHGIYLEYSDDNTISGNTAYSNNYGIYLEECSSNIISGNILNNQFYGLYLKNSHDNTVSGNTVNSNQGIGINLIYSNDNTIWGNLIKKIRYYGIYITSGQNNLIYYNSLIGTFGTRASDSGTNTQWNNLGIGNYWDTHTAPDSDDNGIVDTPYTWILGSAGSNDSYPLAESPVHEGEKIYIDDSGMSAWDWSKTAKLKVWCSGSGTEEDPYVIQDLIINGGGSGSCILIENSNVYFRIENCVIYNSGSGESDAGIKLVNTNNGEIINNYCLLNKNGIYLDSSNYNTISGNTANKNLFGIHLEYSYDNIVSGNTANNNGDYGIYLWSSDDNIISGNTANNNGDYGIFLEISNNNSFSGNIMIESGLFIIGNNREQCSSHNIDTTNLVNGKPIYYYANKIGLELDDFSNGGQLILANCSDSIISNLHISHGTIGISLLYSNNNTILRCTMSNNAEYGIYLYYSNNNIFSRNIANNNNEYGICLEYSNDNIISENTANENDKGGIYLDASNYNTISGNTANENDKGGIYLDASNYNTISGNTANNNGYGILLMFCNNNTVSGNTA
ncbi:MAG: right-handed parallel beta-helix repeat-containing protein, partial [Candidatus Hodarchaeota archaeon]